MKCQLLAFSRQLLADLYFVPPEGGTQNADGILRNSVNYGLILNGKFMLISIAALLLITLGGTILTYLYDTEDPLMVRLCAGNVIGGAVFGLAAFVLACFFGLSVWVVLVSLAIALLPLLLLTRKDIRKNFLRDWRRAEGRMEGTTNKKLLNLAYYFGIFLLLYLFFDRAMIEAKDGIYTGVAHNLGDLHFHLDAIFSFTEGQNFPPENPSFAGVKFTYPIMADLISACLVTLGAGVRQAMFWQNVMLGFSLVVLLENFTFKLTRSKTAGKIAPLLLLFSGGLGFIIFFRDFFEQTQDLFTFLWHLPNDYTIRFEPGFYWGMPWSLRWGNALLVLFITQRSLLFGMPLTLIVFAHLWKLFNPPAETKDKGGKPRSKIYASLMVGALAGFLPLIHAHSLLVVFMVAGFLALLTWKKWKEWLAFFIGAGLIAAPELLWAMSGSATRAKEFIDWHFGWDSRDMNILAFWFLNTGLFIPLLLAAVLLTAFDIYRKKDDKHPLSFDNAQRLLLFYVPFALCFIISNAVKLAPWEWDNIKVLIYWFVGSLPLVALLLAKVWKMGRWQKLLAGGALAVLIFSGALDVWRAISGTRFYRVSDKDAVKIAEDIKRETEPRALFLNAPIFNTPVGLSGRRSLMRYSGHLSSHGIDFVERENDVKKIYLGLPTAEMLMRKYNIEYVLIGPEERNTLKAKEEFFSRYPLVAEEGAYRVYKVKK